jgi:phosphoribosylamine--glycine ligase
MVSAYSLYLCAKGVMKLLVLGSGGREHALAWKLAESSLCEKLYIAPGNAGTATVGENIDISPSDFQAVRDAVLRNQIQMVIVGPEQPLVEGIRDFFLTDPSLQHVALIGPSGEASRLEGSKAYAKSFMEEYGIPTAAYRSFTVDESQEAVEFIRSLTPPVVVKADGLAAGKGVLICEHHAEAEQALKEMWAGKFGSAGERVVIEEFLEGREFSVFVLTDGKDWQLLPVAKDYKRVGEGDTGPNTGGMGCISPVPFVDELMMEKVKSAVIDPTLQGIRERKLDYQGFLFFGLIEVNGDPFVIEYNCRLGDPETEVILPRLKNDLLSLLIALVKGKLDHVQTEELPDHAAAVIVVSGGYPGSYEKGKSISQLDKVTDCLVFHAGTRREEGQVLTNGGRVIALTALSDSLEEAVQRARSAAGIVEYEGKVFRRDIGSDLLHTFER